MKIFVILTSFILLSCSVNNKITDICLDTDKFNIVLNGYFDKLNRKYILNSIINETNIKIDLNSNTVIVLDVNTNRNTSLISLNNVSEIENISFTVFYKVIKNDLNKIIDKGRFVIITSKNISDDRFVNYATENFIMDNFAKNLAVKLENRINILLKRGFCKKDITTK